MGPNRTVSENACGTAPPLLPYFTMRAIHLKALRGRRQSSTASSSSLSSSSRLLPALPAVPALPALPALASLALVFLLLAPAPCRAQFTKEVELTFEKGQRNPLYDEAFGGALEKLQKKIRIDDPTMADVFAPNQGAIDTSQYIVKPPATSRRGINSRPDYYMDVIFDPCRDKVADCCSQKYGKPEYYENINTDQQRVLEQDGTEILDKYSRIQTREVLYDNECLGLQSPVFVGRVCTACMLQGIAKQVIDARSCELQFPAIYKRYCEGVAEKTDMIDKNAFANLMNVVLPNPYGVTKNARVYCFVERATANKDGVATCSTYVRGRDDCVAFGVKRYQPPENPACWDYNATVKSGLPCRNKKGERVENCVEIGYSQNAYIVNCSPDASAKGNCGAYLEVHEPEIDILGNRVDNTKVLTQMLLPGGFVSGYETIPMPTTFADDPLRILCEGDYELWWVQRTLSNLIIEKKLKFRVLQPSCDWDRYNKRCVRVGGTREGELARGRGFSFGILIAFF